LIGAADGCGAGSKLEIAVQSGGIMKFLPALAMLFTTAVVVTADGVPTVVTYVPHDKVSATMVGGGQIIDDHGLIVLAQRRSAGEVEVHEKTNHVFIIVEGEATFVTGGTLVGARETAPGQRRASSVQGGQVYHLTKGDVITIPAKTPHWFKDVPTKTIAYYAVNTEQ
jgi:mannose-6-phosphate isomerase-like protein (cupin superfamily)